MPDRYRLSTSNAIYLLVVIIVAVAIILSLAEKSSYAFGQLTGMLLGLFIVSVVPAWIVWRLSGRGKRGGSWTFNIMLTLGLLVQFDQVMKRAEQRESLERLGHQRDQAMQRMAAAEDPAEVRKAANQFADTVQSEFGRLSEQAAGEEQQYFAIMQEAVAEMQSTTKAWQDATAEIQSPRILDVSLLTSDAEFAHQTAVVRDYVAKSQAYGNCVASFLTRLKEKLSVLGDNSKLVQGTLEGASRGYAEKKAVLDPLIAAHIEYGSKMIEFLELLRENRAHWTYENGLVQFTSESLSNTYNQIIATMAEQETLINTLGEQLLQTQ